MTYQIRFKDMVKFRFLQDIDVVVTLILEGVHIEEGGTVVLSRSPVHGVFVTLNTLCQK